MFYNLPEVAAAVADAASLPTGPALRGTNALAQSLDDRSAALQALRYHSREARAVPPGTRPGGATRAEQLFAPAIDAATLAALDAPGPGIGSMPLGIGPLLGPDARGLGPGRAMSQVAHLAQQSPAARDDSHLPVRSLSFSQDGRLLCSTHTAPAGAGGTGIAAGAGGRGGGGGGTNAGNAAPTGVIRIWDVDRCVAQGHADAALLELPLGTSSSGASGRVVTCWHPRRPQVFAGMADGRIRMFDLHASQKALAAGQAGPGGRHGGGGGGGRLNSAWRDGRDPQPVHCLAAHPSGDYLFVGGGYLGGIGPAATSSDSEEAGVGVPGSGTEASVVSSAAAVRMYDSASLTCYLAPAERVAAEDAENGAGAGCVRALACDQSGYLYAVGTDRGQVRVVDVPSGRLVSNLGAVSLGGEVVSLQFSASGRMLLVRTRSDEAGVVLVDLLSGRVVQKYLGVRTTPGHVKFPSVHGDISAACLSPDETAVGALCANSGVLSVWDTRTAEPRSYCTLDADGIPTVLAAAPAGSITAQPLGPGVGEADDGPRVPDLGGLFATGGPDSSVRLWAPHLP
ncbi:hypothetical protein, variant [Fonticula alba]|nr:hypothetical protein, variant [Fonticula alba]KCV69933.1 hypothetical protein, variant [Fonticula alba]|eukprot:XP_009495539.1 hypothetical protein, variant [Fonticula alba]